MQITPITFKNYFSRLTTNALLILLFLIVSENQLLAQGQTCTEELFPLQDENRKVGYVNAFGEWRVIPFYTKALPFRGKVAIVVMGSAYGVINCEGNVVFKPQFQEIKEYSGGVTWAKKDDLWGLISDTGSVISEFQYQEINEVGSYSYVTWVMKDLKWQLLSNFTGKAVNLDFFDEVKVLNFQTSLVKKELLIGLLNNETGKYIIQPDFQKVFKIAPNVFSAIKDNKWYLYSDKGKLLTATYYDSISEFGKFRFLVKKEGKYGVLDYKGKTILPTQFDQIQEPSNAHFIALKNNKFAYYTIYGQKVKWGYNHAEPFYDGVALAKDSSFKILNLYTKSVHDLSGYDTVYRQAKTHNFVALKNDNTYLLNSKGEKTIPDAYGAIHLNASSDWIYLTNTEGCHYYNTKTKALSSYYNTCSEFQQQYAAAKKNKAWVILNSSGKELPFELKQQPNFIFLNGKTYGIATIDDRVKIFNLDRKHLLTEIKGSKVYSCGKYFSVLEKDAYKLVDDDGIELLKAKYDTIITTPEFEWPKIISVKGTYNLVSEKGDLLHQKGFEDLQYFTENLLKIKGKEGYGVLSAKGEILIPMEYEAIGEYEEYYLSVEKNGLWGYVNLKNQTRIPLRYLETNPFKDQIAVVKIKEHNYAVIDKRGQILAEGFTHFLINEEGDRTLSSPDYILKIKAGKLIKSYNYTKN